MSPRTNRHAHREKIIQKKLDALLTDGEAFQEWAIATREGTKQACVIWASSSRHRRMDATGDPTTLAPEICVEVMSDADDWDEMHAKREVYREAGVQEVCVIRDDGRMHFFRDEEVEISEIAPDFPQKL